MSYENGQHSAAVKRLLRKQHQSALKHKMHISRKIIFLYRQMCSFVTATSASILVVQG